MALSDEALIGVIVAGSVVGFILLVVIILLLLRCWFRGPTTGSDNPKRLDDKVRFYSIEFY